MNSLQGKWILISGASAGIGEACAKRFASEGANLILLARRLPKLETLQQELQEKAGEVVVYEVDVRDRVRLNEIADALQSKNITPDVLINNAGVPRGLDKIYEGSYQDWDEMIDTNIKGLLNTTRIFLPAMVTRNQGHVINIGSIAGHQVYPGGNVYNATKFAVKALSEATNIDLVGTNIKVTSIDPGAVETEFSEVRFHGNKDRAKKVYEGYTPLVAEDIADVIAYVAHTPPHVNITQVQINPIANRNVYVLHRG